jgi:hypothetical protein
MDEVSTALQGVGVSEHDALVIADCIVTRKSCSWVNTDPVDEKMLRDLANLIKKNEYRIKVDVQPVPTRSKFIWEVKVEQ